jgi:cytochrome c oxidase subunit 1
VSTANAGVDRSLQDTYYVGASTTLCSARSSPSLPAGTTGSQDDRLHVFGGISKLHFWLTFIGVNIVFFLTFPRLAGMPRRIADYPDAFAGWCFVSSLARLSGFGALVFFFGVAYAFLRRSEPATIPGVRCDRPGWTLPSPPPFHQYNELPLIN